MTTKHTPGPWHLAEYNFRDTLGAVGVYSAECHPQMPIVHSITGRDLDQCDANARLIAAAPELLAALELVVGAVTYHTSHHNIPPIPGLAKSMQAARAAIAKATRP